MPHLFLRHVEAAAAVIIFGVVDEPRQAFPDPDWIRRLLHKAYDHPLTFTIHRWALELALEPREFSLLATGIGRRGP